MSNLGVTPQTFELPDSSDDSSEESGSRHSSSKSRTPGYRAVPTEDPDAQAEEGARDRAERAADGTSPTRRSAGPRRPPPGLSSLSVTDSFILRQLRGWRLLSGAHLSTEDVRSVMASTNNRLDYDNIFRWL